jgi:hypothetical protein
MLHAPFRPLRLLRGAIPVLLAFSMVAAACGGDDGDADPDETTTTAGDATTTTAGDATTTTAGDATTTTAGDATTTTAGDGGSTTTAADAGEFYVDPRGGLHAEFQQTFDRSTDPFSSVDEFCQAHDAPAEALEETDAVSADSIKVVHLRTKLEDLESSGFAVPVGNTTDMFETFVRVINEQCGGINGRQIDLQLVEVAATGENIDAERRNACVQATEDINAPIVLNSSGFQGSALLCITEEHDSILYTSTSGEDEWVERSGGRLISYAPTLNENVRYLARYLGDKGVLEGKKIAVVTADTPGQPEAIEEGLINTLEDEYGIEVAQFDVIGCAGSSICTSGTPASVDQLIANGIDVLFPALNVISLPQYVKEMADKGIVNGQIQMYQSNFNSQAGDLVSSQVVKFGSEAAGTLYNGTIAVDPAPSGNWREEGFQKSPFNAMCETTYAENNTSGDSWDLTVEEQNTQAGMVGTVCHQVRAAARAIYHAGANPTRADLLEAFRNLGPIDANYMEPGILSPDRLSGADLIYELKFNYPCPVSATALTCFLVESGPTKAPRDPS